MRELNDETTLASGKILDFYAKIGFQSDIELWQVEGRRG